MTLVAKAGAKGDKGDKGDTGAAGAKGDKGDKGEHWCGQLKATKAIKVTLVEPALKGDKGDKGDTGAAGAKRRQKVKKVAHLKLVDNGDGTHTITITDLETGSVTTTIVRERW